MPRYMCVMKLDPSDNRVAKYCEHPTKAEADAHVAAHIGNYPDAFVHEDGDAEPTVDISAWRFDPVSKEILDRIKRPKPMHDWKGAMSVTDADIPRPLEDIYDALGEDAQGRVPQITRDRITAKKTLRGEKP